MLDLFRVWRSAFPCAVASFLRFSSRVGHAMTTLLINYDLEMCEIRAARLQR